MTMVRILLALTASHLWPPFQMDVKNEFFHWDLKEEVHMRPPLGLRRLPIPSDNYVCQLQRPFMG